MDASEVATEGIWLKEFFTELSVVPSALDTMEIFCDHTGAISLAKEPRCHKSSKHIKLRFHQIHEHVNEGDITISKVHTDQNITDLVTKVLPQTKHDQHQNVMGVKFPPM